MVLSQHKHRRNEEYLDAGFGYIKDMLQLFTPQIPWNTVSGILNNISYLMKHASFKKSVGLSSVPGRSCFTANGIPGGIPASSPALIPLWTAPKAPLPRKSPRTMRSLFSFGRADMSKSLKRYVKQLKSRLSQITVTTQTMISSRLRMHLYRETKTVQ